MQRHRFFFASLLAFSALLILLVGIGLAQQPTNGQEPANASEPGSLQPERLAFDGEVRLPEGVPRGPLSQQVTGPVQIMIELEGEPTTRIYAATAAAASEAQAVAAAQAQLASLEAAQQTLMAPLAQLDATVLYSLQRVFNGIAVEVDAGQLAEIRRLPGVKAVHSLPIHELQHTTSVPLVGAPAVWDPGNLDLTGEGIRIGIIDTGIDYLHANFGGSGHITPTLYDDNDTNIIGDVPGFPGVKVVGGYDFAGDLYHAGCSAEDEAAGVCTRIPDPNPDPWDCNGHGTHVAGTAAGYGVTTDGMTYTGAYTATLPTENFRIVPGVAPQASLYALKVFGCDGSTALVAQALEWAVDPSGDGDFSDRLDVVNMSLGANYGTNFDTSAVAADNAALVGTIVVASAGNSGDVYYITGSPATSDRTISVASSVDASAVVGGFEVLAPPALAGVHPAAEAAFGPDLQEVGPITGTLVYPSDQNLGCDPFSEANGQLIDGNIALLDRGVCPFVTKVMNSQTAGAIGVLIANNIPGDDPFTMGGTDPAIVIPSQMTTYEVGQQLQAALQTDTVEVVLTAEYRNQFLIVNHERTDTLSAFSSRGPRRLGSVLKPDITAPGHTIFSSATETGNEGASLSGTSMSAPHVAGAMALLRQLHPTWTVEELKALAMNTALHDLRSANPLTSDRYGPGRVGAGRLDADQASQSHVVAYNYGGPGLVSISFGNPEVLGNTTMARVIRVANKSTQSVTYDVGYHAMTDNPGVEYTLSHSSVTLSPLGATNIVVTMTADASQMKHTRDATVPSAVGGLPRNWISEESGYVTLVPTGSTFAADLSGDNVVAQIVTDASGTTWFTYTAATRELAYHLEVSDIANVTMAHIHRGLEGTNGPVAYWLYDPTGERAPAGPLEPGSPVSGVVTLSAADEMLLLSGSLYVNVHTENYPGGEIRGQILNTTGQSPLRVPVHAAPRAASDMRAAQDSIDLGVSTAITLTGQGLETGSNFPTDYLSLVSSYELQYANPDSELGPEEGGHAELQYVGVTSNIRATATVTHPQGIITDTVVLFAIATHEDWSTPNEVEFDIYIDVDGDGNTDFILFNWNLSPFGFSSDTFYTFLFDPSTGIATAQAYVNGISPGALNTALFNSNVMVLPVWAEDLGLTEANSTFNYHVVTLSRDVEGFGAVVDSTDWRSYDAANPGLDMTAGSPYGTTLRPGLPGTAIPVEFDTAAYLAARSQGVLLAHHLNTGDNRAEVVDISVRRSFIPVVLSD